MRRSMWKLTSFNGWSWQPSKGGSISRQYIRCSVLTFLPMNPMALGSFHSRMTSFKRRSTPEKPTSPPSFCTRLLILKSWSLNSPRKQQREASVISVPTAPWKKFKFLEDPRTFEGRVSARGLRRFRKAHLENILPRGSRDRDPRWWRVVCSIFEGIVCSRTVCSTRLSLFYR